MSLAGMATVAAGLCLLISGVCLGVFFATEKETWGRANDATTALFALLLIPAVLEIRSLYATDARWIGALSAVCLAGLCTIAATSGLTAMGTLDWKRSAEIGAFGFVALLLWMLGTCMLILGDGQLPRFLGWLGFVTAVLVGLAVGVALGAIVRRGSVMGQGGPSSVMSIVAVLAWACFVLWTVWLGLSI